MEHNIDAQCGPEINIKYESALQPNSYITPVVKVEYNCKNEIKPNDEIQIYTDLSEVVKGLDLPSPTVKCLSIYRTFWEKITLIYDAIKRNRLSNNSIPPVNVPFSPGNNRLSRHWYDVYQLIEKGYSKKAISDYLDVFKDVIKVKNLLYPSGKTNYKDCIGGALFLTPEDTTGLERDYKAMQDNGMFSEEPPNFDHLIEKLKTLEAELNKLLSK